MKWKTIILINVVCVKALGYWSLRCGARDCTGLVDKLLYIIFKGLPNLHLCFPFFISCFEECSLQTKSFHVFIWCFILHLQEGGGIENITLSCLNSHVDTFVPSYNLSMSELMLRWCGEDNDSFMVATSPAATCASCLCCLMACGFHLMQWAVAAPIFPDLAVSCCNDTFGTARFSSNTCMKKYNIVAMNAILYVADFS